MYPHRRFMGLKSDPVLSGLIHTTRPLVNRFNQGKC